MQLSHYLYGRKPEHGLAVIARSSDLPFYQQEWLNAPRYGSAPVVETPERIWTQRYELQTLDVGAVLSCLYPLKQTNVPCSRQQAPYPKGITPAVHHLLIARDDLPALLEKPENAVYFDAFLPIDDIYTLDGSFLPPVHYAPPTPAREPLGEALRYECQQLASYYWRALVTRQERKLAQLAQRRILLIVPRSNPAQELETQRNIVAHVLSLLPPHIRLRASYTLNLDVESTDLPANSSLYGMSRVQAGSQPAAGGTVFDLEHHVYPVATDMEGAYFSARAAGEASPVLDALLMRLPQAMDLDFCIRLWQIEAAIRAADPTVSVVLEDFIRTEALDSQRDALQEACLQIALELCGTKATPKNLATLWRLLGLYGDADLSGRDGLVALKPALNDILMVLARDPSLQLPPDPASQDDVFCAVATRSITEKESIADHIRGQLLTYLGNTTLSDERVAAWQPLINGLLIAGQLVPPHVEHLMPWLHTQLFLRMQSLKLPAAFQEALNGLDDTRLRGLLMEVASVNESTPATTSLERCLLALAEKRSIEPPWSMPEYELFTARILALTDRSEPWPAYVLRGIANAANQADYSDICYSLMRKPWVRSLTATASITSSLLPAYMQRSLQQVLKAMDTAQETLLLPERWKELEGETPLPEMQGDMMQATQKRLAQLVATLPIEKVAELADTCAAANLPEGYRALVLQALASRGAALLNGLLADASQAELQSLRKLVKRSNHDLSPGQQDYLRGLDWLDKVSESLKEMPKGDAAWFLALRRGFATLPPDARTLALAILKRDHAKSIGGILLANLQPDDTVNWAEAFPALRALHSASGQGKDALELSFSLLCKLYPDDGQRKVQWLHELDMDNLAQEVRTHHTLLLHRLEKDHKKQDDLPEAMRRHFDLHSERR